MNPFCINCLGLFGSILYPKQVFERNGSFLGRDSQELREVASKIEQGANLVNHEGVSYHKIQLKSFGDRKPMKACGCWATYLPLFLWNLVEPCGTLWNLVEPCGTKEGNP